jgi:hypothetical protein
MQNTNSIEQKVRFLTCFDSANIPYSSDWVSDMNPMDAAQQCAQGLDMSWTAITTCGGNYTTGVVGPESLKLAAEAAAYFLDTFPLFNGKESPMFHVPHVFINNQEQPLDNLENMWNLTATLCQNGAAAAVCESIQAVQPLSPIWMGATKDAVVV